MSKSHKPIYVEQHSFLRPPVDLETLCDTSTPFTFYITDADDTNSITTQWDVEKRLDPAVKPNYWGYFVRLFGVDEIGHSVTAYVNGFKPFVYTQAPPSWDEHDMERAFAWIKRRCRRLMVRWERKVVIWNGFVSLGLIYTWACLLLG